jgi:hypothetical protein
MITKLAERPGSFALSTGTAVLRAEDIDINAMGARNSENL